MPKVTAEFPLVRCDTRRATSLSMEALNRACYCLSLDEQALRRGLEAELGALGLPYALAETHPHLFASVPMFVSRVNVEWMARLIKAVEAVIATPHFRRAVLAWAPEIARYDPGSPGGLLGYDFHLADNGPQLIEINTNPGGALLNAVMGRAHRSCCAEAVELAMVPMEAEATEDALFEVFMTEWRLQRGDAPLTSVAIIDDAPEQQYLYPEFLLYRQLFSRHGVEVTICDPRELVRKDARLWNGSQRIDYVYNRLTDFALERPLHEALRMAYLAGEVVVSPHPRAHAFFADKRNLTLLCDESFLLDAGIPDVTVATLLGAIPRTEIVTAENRGALWERPAMRWSPDPTIQAVVAARRGRRWVESIAEPRSSVPSRPLERGPHLRDGQAVRPNEADPSPVSASVSGSV